MLTWFRWLLSGHSTKTLSDADAAGQPKKNYEARPPPPLLPRLLARLSPLLPRLSPHLPRLSRLSPLLLLLPLLPLNPSLPPPLLQLLPLHV